MKIQHLAVIFILIIMPISIVFSAYLDNQITIIRTEELYNSRLQKSTFDSVKAFQLNTINTPLYVPENRVKNIEAAVSTFFTSLSTSFNYEGNASNAMKEYIPAVVLTMYDGYYIYSPFVNVLTNVTTEVDEKYQNNTLLEGLKPYVSYTCQYNYLGKNYYITYSMENYIIVDVFNGTNYERHEGYLVNDIDKLENNYTYDNITFKENDTEKLNEYLYFNDSDSKMYYYTVLDGTKYYYEGNKDGSTEPGSDDKIFYIDDTGNKHYQLSSYENNKEKFLQYYNQIFKNSSAYEYYKNAYEFTKWVRENLGGLKAGDIIQENISDDKKYEFVDVGKIFEGNIQDSDSNFNRHRADVIRSIISTNLQASIAGFSKYSNSGEEFLMPKISENDWELLENNVCMATFLQGMKIGGKTYNNYSVVPNNFNKEFIDENDIYILKNDNTYAKANDKTISSGTIKTGLDYQPGILKINFEKRKNVEGKYFNPISYLDGDKYEPYLGSYTSIAGNSGVVDIYTSDMYKYMRNLSDETVKRAYYTALGRERQSSFKYTTNEI